MEKYIEKRSDSKVSAGYTTNTMASPRPTHEEFNEEYQNKGLQPTYKSQVSYQNEESDTDTDESDQYISNEYVGGTYASTRVSYRNNRTKSKIPRLKKPQTLKTAKKGVAYTRVTVTNLSIISWGMTLWSLQFAFALLSLAALGAIGAIDVVGQNELGKWVIEGITGAYDTAEEALGYLGISDVLPSSDDLKSMMGATTLLPTSVGLITLLLASLQYIFMRFKPLFGRGSELKVSAFIIALIGYFIPIMNIFPWFIFWVLAVWRYPK